MSLSGLGRPRAARAAALFCAAALLAASCGSDDDEGAPGAAEATTTAPAPAAKDEAFGRQGDVVTGRGGLRIDLKKCASGWSDTAGITDKEIRLGQSYPMSGSLASTAPLALGVRYYYEHINRTEGGVGGKTLSLATKDDGYEAARTTSNVTEFLETGNVFAMTSIGGTPPNLAVRDVLNERCVPQLMPSSGHHAFGDPENYPWTTSGILDYRSEPKIWSRYITEAVGKGASIAALVLNNDFGKGLSSSFTQYGKEEGLNLTKVVTHEANAPTLTNEITTLTSSGADVALIITTGNYCTQALQGVANSVWKPKLKLMFSGCALTSLMKPVGAGADGWVSFAYNKDLSDKALANDPGVVAARKVITDGGANPDDNSYYGLGVFFAVPTVEMFKRAAKRPGGLTRSNVAIEAWGLKFNHPLLFEGVAFEANGLQDPYYVQGGQPLKYTIQPGQDVGVFAPFGKAVDVNGSIGPCKWDGRECAA
ncbi:MAG: ABC transporter substrate-binding protein [Acidimicrobiales bacterium]